MPVVPVTVMEDNRSSFAMELCVAGALGSYLMEVGYIIIINKRIIYFRVIWKKGGNESNSL